MFRFLIKTLFVFGICYSWDAYSSDNTEVDIKDYALSKHTFLVSNFSYDDLVENNSGAMTLCFRKNESKGLFEWDHAAIVFEYFIPEKSKHDIVVNMVHYDRNDDCCTEGKGVRQDNMKNTLAKVYRGVKKSSYGNDEHVGPLYSKYASWIIPNETIRNTLDKKVKVEMGAEEKKDKKNMFKGNCVKYAISIMKHVGLQKADLGWWISKPENLKLLVKDYVEPKPNFSFLPDPACIKLKKDGEGRIVCGCEIESS